MFVGSCLRHSPIVPGSGLRPSPSLAVIPVKAGISSDCEWRSRIPSPATAGEGAAARPRMGAYPDGRTGAPHEQTSRQTSNKQRAGRSSANDVRWLMPSAFTHCPWFRPAAFTTLFPTQTTGANSCRPRSGLCLTDGKGGAWPDSTPRALRFHSCLFVSIRGSHYTSDRHQPTLPSRLRPSSFCASTANSIGREASTSRQKPFTIIETASSSLMPRWRQ